jgi:hypothetical protein
MWLHGGGENADVPEKFQRTRRLLALSFVASSHGLAMRHNPPLKHAPKLIARNRYFEMRR